MFLPYLNLAFSRSGRREKLMMLIRLAWGLGAFKNCYLESSHMSFHSAAVLSMNFCFDSK